MTSPFDVFLEPEAQRINRARLEHLATLGLDLDHKRVLEVGAGIGLHTWFFEQRGCNVLSTDGAPANVAEMMRRWPDRQLGVLDLDHPGDLDALGIFDVVFCYGTLYHLRDPDGALARIAKVSGDIILLETVVSRGAHAELNPVQEPAIANQAVSGIGCRPTRAWVMSALRRHFGHAYTTLDQPDYPDFTTDWSVIGHNGNLRAVFIGARRPLALPALTGSLPIRHRNAPSPRRQPLSVRVWLDVGAHRGEHSRAVAQNEPALEVHAFEPLPTLFDELSRSSPNYHVHAMAIGERDGMAEFRVNRFEAASSLLPMDEATRTRWLDGHLLHEDRVIQVPVTRLDSFMERHGIRHVEFLKIDAQGGDLAVLRSAGDRLVDIDRVQLEVAVTPTQLYQGAAAKPEILAYMAEHGFRLLRADVQSHGQEENLTFERAHSLAAIDARPAVPAPREGDTVDGLYDLDRAQLAHGEIRQVDDVMELVTDPQQWAYTMTVPIGDAFRDGDTGRYQVQLAIQVEQGVIQVGILNREETDFPSSAVAATSPVWQTLDLITPPLDRAGPLVIRNASDTGPSRARCRLVAVLRFAAPVTEETVEAAPSPQEAHGLADQLRVTAEVLERITNADPKLATAVAPIVVQAAARLRRPLARGGQSLITTQAAPLETIFSSFTSHELERIAAAIAVTPSLHPVPDWRMDGFLESGDLATFVRYAIWLALRQRSDAAPIILPWHHGTCFGLRLGNDLSQAMFVGGTFEPNETALLDRVLQEGMTVLDGGANEGIYTVFLAAKVGPGGRVIAVEPSPRELERLKANITLNALSQVTMMQAALADQSGEVELLLAEAAHAGQNTLGSFMYTGVAAAGSVRVHATTIDLLVATQGLSTLDVIKLDLEGAELRALTGARETLQRCRPLLLFEAAPAALARQGGSVRQTLSLLADCGYCVLALDPQTGEPVPLGADSLSDNLVAVHRDRDWGLPTG